MVRFQGRTGRHLLRPIPLDEGPPAVDRSGAKEKIVGGVDEYLNRKLVHHRYLDRRRRGELDAREAAAQRCSGEHRRAYEEVVLMCGSCWPPCRVSEGTRSPIGAQHSEFLGGSEVKSPRWTAGLNVRWPFAKYCSAC